MMGWQLHRLDHMQIVCTLLQTDLSVRLSIKSRCILSKTDKYVIKQTAPFYDSPGTLVCVTKDFAKSPKRRQQIQV